MNPFLKIRLSRARDNHLRYEGGKGLPPLRTPQQVHPDKVGREITPDGIDRTGFPSHTAVSIWNYLMEPPRRGNEGLPTRKDLKLTTIPTAKTSVASTLPRARPVAKPVKKATPLPVAKRLPDLPIAKRLPNEPVWESHIVEWKGPDGRIRNQLVTTHRGADHARKWAEQGGLDVVRVRPATADELKRRRPVRRVKFARDGVHPTKTPEFKSWFGDWESEPHLASKVVDDTGKPKVVYHGAKRSDRIGDEFKKNRATSGPMSFFTDDAELAASYATGKQDTSLQAPSYEEQFRYKPQGSRSTVGIDRAWHFLPYESRAKIASMAPRVGVDDDGNLVVHPEGHKTGTGGYDYHIQEARGNHLKALVEEWLNSGNLIDSEGDFLDVLKAAGMDHPVRYEDPYAVRSGTVPVYLSLKNPLVTTDIPGHVVDDLEKTARRQRPAKQHGADFWDKNTKNAMEWVKVLKDDIASGTNSYAWTSIPDWVTKVLKKHGYDGIQDVGGKMGGQGHTVYIPFEPHQIKSAIANRGGFSSKSKKITRSRPGRPLKLAAYRAPAGGAVVRGVYYQGGKMIPDLTKFAANEKSKPQSKLERLLKSHRRNKSQQIELSPIS